MIEGRQRPTPYATFHSLRHSFVSFATNSGVPLPVIQSIVGHHSSAMTRHYYHVNEKALRKAVDSVPDFEENLITRGDIAHEELPKESQQKPPDSQVSTPVKTAVSHGVRSLVKRMKEAITIFREGEKRRLPECTILMRPRIICSQALKSAITPSRRGRIVRISGLVFSYIILALSPTAIMRSVRRSRATTLGSSTTILPSQMMMVLAVPRSIAISLLRENQFTI